MEKCLKIHHLDKKIPEKARESYQNLSKEEQNENMVKVSQKVKNKEWLSIEKNIIKYEKIKPLDKKT